jgi:hypothetical protein
MKKQTTMLAWNLREPETAGMRNSTQETVMRETVRRACGARRGGVLAGLLISGAVILCIVVASGMFVARSVKVHSAENGDGQDVSIDTPVGHLSVRAHDKAGWASDVPIYPGARQAKDNGGNATVEWTTDTGKGDKGFSVEAAEMITPDSAAKVLDFYRTQLPAWVIAHEDDGAVRLQLTDGGYKRIVSIHRKHDGTHIGVASVGKPASN